VIHYLPCFGEWIIACLLSVFTAFPVFIYWYFGTETRSLPHPLSSVYFQCSTCSLHCPCLITVCCLLFCFVEGDQSAQGLCWFMFLGGGKGSPAWCVMLICLFCQMMCRQVWAGGSGGSSSGSGGKKWHQIFSV
jgi:hypothetical protein